MQGTLPMSTPEAEQLSSCGSSMRRPIAKRLVFSCVDSGASAAMKLWILIEPLMRVLEAEELSSYFLPSSDGQLFSVRHFLSVDVGVSVEIVRLRVSAVRCAGSSMRCFIVSTVFVL